MKERSQFTILILTKNAEGVIGECIASASFADEVLVVDSGSTDGTIELAESLGARVVIESQWRGYGPQRQYAQTLASHDWIFWLDSDERITPELQANILSVLKQPAPGLAWQVNRCSDFFGKLMRHGDWYPDWVVRLHHRDQYQYDDAPVHESIKVPKKSLLSLKGDLLHLTTQHVDAYLSKSLRYALLWAEKNHSKRVTAAGVALRPLWTFLRCYLIKLGCLDGVHGLLLAIQSSHYTFTKYFALWVAQQRRQR